MPPAIYGYTKSKYWNNLFKFALSINTIDLVVKQFLGQVWVRNYHKEMGNIG